MFIFVSGIFAFFIFCNIKFFCTILCSHSANCFYALCVLTIGDIFECFSLNILFNFHYLPPSAQHEWIFFLPSRYLFVIFIHFNVLCVKTQEAIFSSFFGMLLVSFVSLEISQAYMNPLWKIIWGPLNRVHFNILNI
jgi:hypothetical protein